MSCVFLISITCSFIYGILGDSTVMYMGCYQDGGPSNRLLKDLQETFPGILTPDKCNDHCLGKGFPYAGTQYSYECFCSKTRPPDDKKTLESECSSKCAGDESKTCGGNNRLAVFSTGAADPATDGDVLRPLGCFQDSDNNRLLNGYRKDFPGTLTNQKCVKLCSQKGFHYAGTEYGRECHCGNRKPSFKEYANDEDCAKRCEGDNNQLCGGNWRIYIYETLTSDDPHPTEDGNYIGCYKDQVNSRALSGHTEEFANSLTPLKCTGLCYSKGFLYSGTQFGYQCFCGDKPPSPNSKVSEDECYKACSGNPALKCGGDSRNSIRETGIQDVSVADKYLGCFNDQDNQIFKTPKLYFEKTNTPRRCMNFCSQLGFHYSGVEYGKECFCGNNKPKADLVVNPENCNMPCSGDPDESCGSGWRLAVYATSLTGPVTPFPYTPSKSCITSETTVSGRDTLCRGDVIFEEQFNSPIGERWSHVVIIPDVVEHPPEYEYAVFVSDSKNSFTSKNKLVMKPTLYNDTFVRSGMLNLEGCTGRAGTRQCGYEAKSYNILPPVASARIHTRNSFSFRYGKVEIRAKLPIGDWLVPELWLEPQSHRYGPAYASGRIQIAMNRGNADLKCNGKDLGFNLLESGVMMGPTKNVRKRSLTTKLPSNWHDHFHNYTLIWTPDKISFKIDNEPPQDLARRRLCEVIGFESDECLIWTSESKIAPFDQDFYISLGLSVGNARDFPDDCMNQGKPKPWRNLEQKALLKFWQDKENWQATWTDENSSLYIDHVRVTAI